MNFINEELMGAMAIRPNQKSAYAGGGAEVPIRDLPSNYKAYHIGIHKS